MDEIHIDPRDTQQIVSKQRTPPPDIKPIRPIEAKVLAPVTTRLQQLLKKQGINSLVAGGLATDLLASSAISSHQTRLHKDIDILVSRAQLWAVDDVMRELGFAEVKTEKKSTNDEARENNLRTFETQDGVRIDIMGYYTIHNSGIGDFPFMSWGKIDLHRTPVSIDLKPVRILYEGSEIEALNGVSLLKLKSAQDTRFNHKKDMAKQRDIQLLQKLVTK